MWQRILVLFITLIPSTYGFYRAVYVSACKDDAARGGAAATAFVLAFVLLSRSYGLDTFLKAIRRAEERHGSTPSDLTPNLDGLYATVDRLSLRLNALAGALDKDGADQKILNLFAAVAAAIATAVWGFGDLIASHYISAPNCH